MADEQKQTQQTAAANETAQTPAQGKATNTPDYTTVTDSGDSWKEEAKAVLDAAASQTKGNPASQVNNINDSDEVGTTSDTQVYTFTDTGETVEANSLAEAVQKLKQNKDKEETK